MTRLYANMNAYNLIIVVENTGTIDCLVANFQLDFHEDLIATNQPSSPILGTIEPGRRREIPITVLCKAIQDEFEFKKIGITITDTVSDRSWDDSVSLKFHKAPVNIIIRSNNSVSSVIISPTTAAYSFTRTTSTTISVPWSNDNYLVVFSGATADTEAIFSLGIHVTPDTNFNDHSGFGDYTNNHEDRATPIATGEKLMSYLYKNAISYYSVNMGSNAPVFNPVMITDHAVREASGGNNDGKVNPRETHYLDIRVRNTVNATINIASATLSTDNPYVTINKDDSTLGEITAWRFKTLTFNTSSSSNAVSATLMSSYSPGLTGAFRFTIAEDCPVGTELPFTVTFTDSWGNTWSDTLTIAVE